MENVRDNYNYLGGYGGWCASCGRQRTPDGRCSNCDAWYTSPMVHFGIPAIAFVAILLIVGIRFASGRSGSATATTSVLAAAPVRPIAPAPGSPYGYTPPPPAAAYVAPVVAPPAQFASYAPTYAPDAAASARLESLRSMVHYTDSTLRAEEYARSQSGSANSTFSMSRAAVAYGNY